MNKEDGFEIIIEAFKHHLDRIKKRYSKNLLRMVLKDVEVSEKTYADYLTFSIVTRYDHKLQNSEVISRVVDEIYKFSNYEKLFGLEKDVHFFYLFTTV